MRPKTKSILTFGTMLFLLGCAANSSRDEAAKAKDYAIADSISAAEHGGFISSSAARENGKDSTRKFIRTADLKFKVKSVINATYKIEDITKRFDGFVTYTNLASNVDNHTTIAVSADSSLETTYFTVTNSITIRVPNTKLDTTLKSISSLIDYLDYRVIKADDIGIQYLANQMTQKRVEKHEERLTNAIDTKGKKLNETTNAEESLLNKQEQADNSKIANLTLNDQVNFSTITLSIYQRQTIKTELIPNNYSNVEMYEPGFGSKFWESIKFGWEILEGLFIFITKLWGIILIGIVTFLIIKKVVEKYSKK
ncbi:MAG: DUF4349 domain-containing protein [Bacteroidia bacterium]